MAIPTSTIEIYNKISLNSSQFDLYTKYFSIIENTYKYTHIWILGGLRAVIILELGYLRYDD